MASTISQSTQCNDYVYEKMKQYFDLYSENNAVETEIEAEEPNRAMLLKHVSLIEEFECEKDEIQTKFAREKESLKRAFENERKEYEAEIERLREVVDTKMNEIEVKYKDQIQKREAIQRDLFEKERAGLRKSVQEQMGLVAEVEGEIKRILKRLLVELKKISPSSCKKLEEDLCMKNMQESCVGWLKEIFNESNSQTGNKSTILKSSWKYSSKIFSLKKDEKGMKDKESKDTREDNGEVQNDELYEVGEVFRKQKKELTEIFMKEKKHLEDEIKNNCLEYKKKLDIEYEARVEIEMKVWQETIKEYEREIAILRYEREQMDRNYCLEMDRLKLETEREKIAICSRYMKEREQLRRTLSDTVVNMMVRENGLTTLQSTPEIIEAGTNDKKKDHVQFFLEEGKSL